MTNTKTRLLPFSWEAYEAGAAVARRDGLRIASLHKSATPDIYSILQVYCNSEGDYFSDYNMENGRDFDNTTDQPADLFIVEEIKPVELWIGVSKTEWRSGPIRGVTHAYESKERATNAVGDPEIYNFIKLTIDADTGELIYT